MTVQSTTRRVRQAVSGARGWRQGGGVLSGVLLLVSSLGAQRVESQQVAVSAVRGDSWLNHLHRSFDETSMGKTGRLGPAAEQAPGANVAVLENAGLPAKHSVPEQSALPAEGRDSASVRLHGSDLYRLSCRGCHGESGAGAPPEIGSVLNPVRATSVELTRQRMRSLGMQMSAGQAAEMAKQSMSTLLGRIRSGGQDMPALSHLSDAEVGALMQHLKLLAQVPGAGAQESSVAESRARVGELIVKSTCRVCHSAVGVNPTPQQLASGAIPPLSTLTARVNEAGLIQKVTQGAPVVMGAPAASYRGRMPVFFYLSREEAADVYLYLAQYPPEQETHEDAPLAAAAGMAPTGGDSGEMPFEAPASYSKTVQRTTPASRAASVETYVVWQVLVGVFVMGLLAAGWTITVREFRRLATENERRRAAASNRFMDTLAPTLVHPMAALAARAAGEASYGRTRESA